MILKHMLNIREDLIEADCSKVIETLMWELYYEVAPRVQSGDTFVLFRTENDLSNFCHNNNLDIRALKWVINSMREEGLVASETIPIILTSFGIEKLCIN